MGCHQGTILAEKERSDRCGSGRVKSGETRGEGRDRAEETAHY